MELTADNVQSVLGVYPERYYKVLPQVFDLLVDPDLEEMALYHYVVAIRDRLEKDERPEGHMGFDTFGEACFEGGIVKAMMKITQDKRTDRWHGLASYFALDSMWHLTKTGTSDERRALLKELLEHNALEICLEKINHPLVIHRQAGTNLLRCFASESFLGEMLSSSQTSDAMMKLCEHILSGPEIYSRQLVNPGTTWQSFLCFGTFGHPREKAGKYGPRYYAMTQENAAWAIQGLLLRSPPPSQQFCYEIISHNPELLDLLFQCAAVRRPPWYPELQVDAIICEAIALLFRVPELLVPGVSGNVDRDFQKVTNDEWDAVLKSVKILTSRPKWVNMILGVWDMMEDEKWQNVRTMLNEVTTRYFAQSRPSEESFLDIFSYRGSCRISMERLIATITHSAEHANISDSDLLSLLRVSSSGSRPVKTMNELYAEVDRYNYLESVFELFRKPMYAVFTQEKVEPPLQIADESVMGPTAHARLLTLLAQRGVLKNIPKMTKLPKGVSARTTLPQLKRIASEDGVRRFLLLARKRVTARREEGHKRFREDNEMDYACIAYFTAAELAAALIAFDTASGGAYSSHLEGTRKELVLCLGNGAEMALGLKQYKRALCLAATAVEAAQSLPTHNSPDAVDENITAKNRRRVERAQAGLSLS